MTSLSHPIILVIDADPLSLTATSALLYSAQYEVHCAATRDAALAAARNLELDLVVCDLDIGGIDGHTIVEEIRQIPDRNDVPVMYASSIQQPEVIRKSTDSGAVYHIRKPFDPQVVLELVDKALWMPHLIQTHISRPHFNFSPHPTAQQNTTIQ
jgi:CheY-like chemotaxis protein